MVPEAEEEFDFQQNLGIDPTQLSVASQTRVNWKCPKCDYRWASSVSTRVIIEEGSYRLKKCPSCCNVKVMLPFYRRRPDLKDRFCEDLNGIPFTALVARHDPKYYWWRCGKCGETYLSTVDEMTKGRKTSYKGCPYCTGQVIRPEDTFGAKHPDLVRELVAENGIDPYAVHEFSREIATWKCTLHQNIFWKA